MPELPEVENMKLQLKKFIVGHIIEKVEVRYRKCFTGDEKKLIGAKIKDIRRFGKVLVIDLSNDFSIVVHVKMTGQLIYRGPNLKNPPKLSEKIKDGLGGKHTHVFFCLDKGGKLYYNDMRKFGWIRVTKNLKLKTEDKFIGKLGPELVIDSKKLPDNPLTLDKFKEMLGKSSRSVKVLLMDQSKIAGIGNIYANDALWLAGISPRRKADSLKLKEIKTLFGAIEKVLKTGLNNNGASENSFVLPDGTEGRYQQQVLVYGREGKMCKRCRKNKIKKIKLGGRGTYFCPACQC